MNIIISAALSFLLLACGHGHHHKRFDNAQKWSKVFEDKDRVNWQKPNEVIKVVGVQKDSIIADIGAATGFFPIRIAKVATEGRTWAIDIEPTLVNFLNSRIANEKVNNVFSILGTKSDPLIPEKVDFIFIVNTYHHINHRDHYFKNLKRYLKPNARVVIIDFKDKKLPIGPKHSKISKIKIIDEMSKNEYKVVLDSDLLEYQNLLIFTR